MIPGGQRGIPSGPRPRARSHLTRVSLADQVRDYLVLEIAQGRLAPGTALRELEIAERLGTSQTPIREAFRQLTALGLLESRVHVGTWVRNLETQELVDAVPVRAALEGLGGRLAAPNIAQAHDECHAALAQMAVIATTDDRLAFASASTRFHRALIAAANNESLLRAWNALGIEVMTILAMASNDDPLVDATESHRLLLHAVETGDPDVAESALRQHVSSYLPGTLHAPAASANS